MSWGGGGARVGEGEAEVGYWSGDWRLFLHAQKKKNHRKHNKCSKAQDENDPEKFVTIIYQTKSFQLWFI
jgi:hypothetical protein